MKDFCPMLAGKAPEDISTLRFPVLVSPKLDGIRAVIRDGIALSRKLKPIPNVFVQERLAGLPEGFDGELIAPGGFNATQSAVMREDGEPDFIYHVFDCVNDRDGFETRLTGVLDWNTKTGHKFVEVVPHGLVSGAALLLDMEREYLAQGYEGAMIRSINGPYKFGRSTTREGYLLKLKRFEDAEATIISVVELQHNDNEATKDELGHTKRSSAKAGKRPADTLGKLLVRRPDGVEFGIGTGFTQAMRDSLWEVRDTLPGLQVCYTFQADPAAPKNAPRFPSYKGLRHRDDT